MSKFSESLPKEQQEMWMIYIQMVKLLGDIGVRSLRDKDASLDSPLPRDLAARHVDAFIKLWLDFVKLPESIAIIRTWVLSEYYSKKKDPFTVD